MILVELETPISRERIMGLRAGDSISLTGDVYTMRDQATLRLLEMARAGEEPPFDLSGGVVYHAGPAVDDSGGKPRVASIGPTTSARVNSIMPEFLERFDVRLVIGKGGMDGGVLEAMGRRGCAYASAIGGCAALYTCSVRELVGITWEEMGPEAVHHLRVERMKPLRVTMDAHGGSIHRDVEEGTGRALVQLLGE
jgi:tartrate/fumarate subfamily iron-sulfur-dependent hydro-lyase beta chain